MELIKCKHNKGTFAHELMQRCEQILSVVFAAWSTMDEALKAALLIFITTQEDIIRSEEEILTWEDCCDLEEDFCEE
jgi:nicotinic acid phosphoribosyltransferase